MNYYKYIVLFTFGLISLLFYIVINYKKHKEIFQICYDIVIVLVTDFVSCYFIFSEAKDINYALIIYLIIYCICVLGIKVIVLLIVVKSKKTLVFNCYEKIHFLFASPDYAITHIIKKTCGRDKDQAELIKTFNLVNLVLSVILALICFFIKNEILKNFIIIRIVYRCIEIIFAFAKDITDKEKSSSLDSRERIKLAILSLIEISALAYGFYKIQNITRSIPQKIIETLMFQDQMCFPIDTLIGITGLVLIGIVIVQYIDSKKGISDLIE